MRRLRATSVHARYSHKVTDVVSSAMNVNSPAMDRLELAQTSSVAKMLATSTARTGTPLRAALANQRGINWRWAMS